MYVQLDDDSYVSGTGESLTIAHGELAQILDLLGRHQKEVSLGHAGIVNGRAVYRR